MRRDWVAREHAPDDRRLVIVKLTDEGQDALVAARQHMYDLMAQLLDKLGLKGRAADIQKLSWQQILQAGGGASPFLDGRYFTNHPFDPAAPMESADVPVIISTTLHDADWYSAPGSH